MGTLLSAMRGETDFRGQEKVNIYLNKDVWQDWFCADHDGRSGIERFQRRTGILNGT
jgi:hypothetical protein